MVHLLFTKLQFGYLDICDASQLSSVQTGWDKYEDMDKAEFKQVAQRWQGLHQEVRNVSVSEQTVRNQLNKVRLRSYLLAEAPKSVLRAVLMFNLLMEGR